MPGFRFKIASEDHEFEQIHRLNYRTFVEEIPQHPPNPSRRLVDRFHEQNTYIICLHEERLVGMVAARGERPFSLDGKLDDLDGYLPPYRKMCEGRLLAVEKAYRRGPVFVGLLEEALSYGRRQGYDLVVMSCTVRQLKLYAHLGFVPFGPLVGTPEARYQPMYWMEPIVREKLGWLEVVREWDAGEVSG